MYIKPEFDLVELEETDVLLVSALVPTEETDEYELGPHEVDIDVNSVEYHQ